MRWTCRGLIACSSELGLTASSLAAIEAGQAGTSADTANAISGEQDFNSLLLLSALGSAPATAKEGVKRLRSLVDSWP